MRKLNLKKLIRPEIKNLKPYEAKEISCSVKLDANESPYGFEDFVETLKVVKTNRYPDPEATELRKVLAKRWGVSVNNLLHGNGSDELIHYLLMTFGGPVLYPVPTFSMYGIISRAMGERVIEVALNRDFDIDIKRTIRAIKRERPRLIFLSSPNNPTGNCLSSEAILRIVEKSEAIVVVDEAYQPFSSKKGFLPFLNDYENLLLMRTLSKIGLAALRIGFLIGRPEAVKEINKVRLPFNVNSYSQAIALTILRQKGLIDRAIKKIISERERLYSALSKMKRVKPFPSEANFILFRVEEPVKVYKSLLKKGILVRNLHRQVKGCLRVTVGDESENSLFLKTLEEVVSK